MRITAETKIATQRRILEVAKKLFAGRGFEPTTTRDIARESQIAVGTLFNYFPTKESIALALVADAYEQAHAALSGDGGSSGAESLTFEEDLFAQVTAVLRKLKPYRKYLGAVLDTALSPAANGAPPDQSLLRTAHLEAVGQIAARHARHEALEPLALQLYWTLYTGVLAFWATDKSPRQEDTLALLDESLAMFVGWLNARSQSDSNSPPTAVGDRHAVDR